MAYKMITDPTAKEGSAKTPITVCYWGALLQAQATSLDDLNSDDYAQSITTWPYFVNRQAGHLCFSAQMHQKGIGRRITEGKTAVVADRIVERSNALYRRMFA